MAKGLLHETTAACHAMTNQKFGRLGLKVRFYASVSLRPKGEILRHARRFVHNGDILRKVFWCISALRLVFEHTLL